MQMRTCRITGGADYADLVAGVHVLADRDRGSLQVRVQRFVAVAVVDDNIVAVAVAVAAVEREDNRSGGSSTCGCTVDCGDSSDDIYAGMIGRFAGTKWVTPPAERA